VEPAAVREVALSFLPLAGLHHLALFVILVVVWSRREAARPILSAYLTVAFATAAVSLLSTEGARPLGPVAVALAALWLAETLRPATRLAFRRTPRPRLVMMGAAAAFAVAYPGHSGELPSFIFSPLGVTLAPTLLASLALLNATEGPTNRTLHWSLSCVGLALGAIGVALQQWAEIALLAVSLYAMVLLVRGGRLLPTEGDERPTSVRDVRQRMYSRWSLLPGPRDPRRRRRPRGSKRG